MFEFNDDLDEEDGEDEDEREDGGVVDELGELIMFNGLLDEEDTSLEYLGELNENDDEEEDDDEDDDAEEIGWLDGESP